MSDLQPTVLTETRGPVRIVTLNRASRRNAVDRETAQALFDIFEAFDTDPEASVAILTGAGGSFCAGADLQALAAGRGNATRMEGRLAPMGPTRMRLSKPVIAAIEGHAVAGGLELALWCDLRVMAQGATLGVYCRRFGVPLVDLGTVRLPRLIGQSRAMDLILTGRPVDADEAADIGLANRLVLQGEALVAALDLAEAVAGFPQTCLRHDRLSVLEQWGLDEPSAQKNEMRHGLETLASGETEAGASDFRDGAGRHGAF